MILDEICAYKREELVRTKQRVPLDELTEKIAAAPAPRNFRAALREPGISLIAEVKKASPVKGEFLPGVTAHSLGNLYEASGARAISVLTDEKYFKGSLQDLTSVHHEVRVPCLRKDFMVDPYQIYEARAAHADAILLIVRVLSDREIEEFQELALSLNMAVLVETHDEGEIERALRAGAHIIGINNRNLDTFEVDLETTLRLKRLVPGGNVLVSESGIFTRKDVQRLEDGGVDAVLVGEAIVTSKNIQEKIQELIGDGAREDLRR